MSGPLPSDGRRSRIGLLAMLIGVAGSCTYEPLPDICPSVDEGELVISELRGGTSAPYVELYNDAGKTVDLQGLVIRVVEAGGTINQILYRESFEVEAGGYVVVAPGVSEAAWINYQYGADAKIEFLPKTLARVELEACGELIDEVRYDALPEDGTLACGNAQTTPSADTNDHDTSGCWCTGSGLGWPGGPNQCP